MPPAPQTPNLRDQIRQILLNDWDPHDASRRLPETTDAYDTYIPAIVAILFSNESTEDAVVNYLYDRERESMCFPGLGKARLLPVARKLLALRGRET